MSESQTLKVAVVDDHRLFRKGIVSILKDADGLDSAFEAANGIELLAQLEAGEQPDVILMDLEMPEMDGMAATEALQKSHPEIKILILSMHAEENFILHLMEKGAHGYLLKDSDPEELERAIFQVVQNGFYFNERLSLVLLKGLKQKSAKKPRLGQEGLLNERELQVLELICMEKTTPEIAEQLFLSPRTIEGYRKSLLEKTETRNTAGLVAYAFRNGIVN